MASTVSLSVKRTSRVGQLIADRLQPTEGTFVHMLKGWRQSVASRVAVLGGQFRRAAAVDQSRLAEDDIDVAQMQAAFAELPAVYQEVLLLQVRWGCSPMEIASELKLSLPHVLTRLRRARQDLRRRLGEDLRMDPNV
jgi:DNA-directed RNA polymerase specialized sigma24 family protein